MDSMQHAAHCTRGHSMRRRGAGPWSWYAHRWHGREHAAGTPPVNGSPRAGDDESSPCLLLAGTRRGLSHPALPSSRSLFIRSIASHLRSRFASRWPQSRMCGVSVFAGRVSSRGLECGATLASSISKACAERDGGVPATEGA
eukprot:828920-Prymnesium_polylepis.2